MPKLRRTRAAAVTLSLILIVATVSVDYTVQQGDTLGRIARDQGVSLSDLIEANDIDNPNLIYPGQVLIIPGEEGKPPVIHIVSRGETLNKIAASYGVSAATLAKINELSNPNLIYPGQELVVEEGKEPGDPGNGGAGGGGTNDPYQATRSGRTHIVRRGETLQSIAAQYKGISAANIQRANGMVDGRIYSGTRLFLDGPSFTAGGGQGQAQYRVVRGDRLSDIAARFNTSVGAIARLNGIQNVNQIGSGQILKLPGGKGSWVCPVDSGTFFNDWGFPRSGGRYHEGNDIFAAFRTPVRAPVSGVVQFITGSVGGYQFTLMGDDGARYLGSHMDGFEGESGRRVEAGEVVGYIGNSGNAVGTRPHLHFGIYIGALAVNPYPSLQANGCK